MQQLRLIITSRKDKGGGLTMDSEDLNAKEIHSQSWGSVT
jgi:hypothetical protein